MRASLVRLGLVVILAALIIVLVPVNRDLAARANLGEDFLPLWLAARVELVEGGSAYDAETMETQYQREFDAPVGAVVSAEDLTFTRPVTAIVPPAPLALAPYPVARSLWLTLLEVLQPILFLLAVELSGLRKKMPVSGFVGVVMFSLLWRYGLEGMIGGHPVALQAALAAAALAMLAHSQFALAGAATAVGVMLGGVLAPMGLFLLLDQLRLRNWGFVVSGLVVLAAGVGGVSFLAGDWLMPWLAVLLNGLRTQGLRAPLSALGPPVVWISSGLLLTLYMLWHWIRLLGRDPIEDQGRMWVACLTLAVSFALLGPLHPSGPLLLVPALMLVAGSFQDRWGRIGSAFVVLGAGLLLVGPWLPLLLEIPLSPTGGWLYWLPLAASLLGLWWVRWWVVRGPKLALSREGVE